MADKLLFQKLVSSAARNYLRAPWSVSYTRKPLLVRYKSEKNDKGKDKTDPSEETEEVGDPYLPPWPNGINPHTGERGGPRGPEPTRYGDWERKGRVTDF